MSATVSSRITFRMLGEMERSTSRRLQIRNHAVVQIQNELQPCALMLQLRAYQPVIDRQRNNVRNMRQDVDLRLRERFRQRPPNAQRSHPLIRSVQRKHGRRRMSQSHKNLRQPGERRLQIRLKHEPAPLFPHGGRQRFV